MISINKEEAGTIRERCPNAHVVRTMKQKSKRHRYYCEESRAVLRVLGELRGKEFSCGKEGVRNTDTKKNR